MAQTETGDKVHDPFDLLVKEIEFQAEYWAQPKKHFEEEQRDPVISALCKAMANQKLDSPFVAMLQETANLRFERRNPRKPSTHNGSERRKSDEGDSNRFEAKSISELVGVVRANICNYAMSTSSGPFSYKGLDKPAAWQDILEKVGEAHLDQSGDDPTANQLAVNLQGNVQTNIAERYTPLEIIMQTYRQRLGHEIDWLDVGTGIMQGPKQLLLKDKYPMKVGSVIDEPGDPYDEVRLTQKVNQLLRLPSQLKNCVAVDLQPPILPHRDGEYDRNIVQWCEASLRPSEFMDQRFMLRYRALMKEKTPKLHFQMADLSSRESMDLFKEQSPVQNFDVISLITVLHQINRGDTKRIFEQSRQMLKPGGIIVVQDFAYFHPRPHGEPAPFKHMRMYSKWFEESHRYRTFVYDSARNNPGLQEVLRSADSRCRELTISKGSLAINGELGPIRNLIEASV